MIQAILALMRQSNEAFFLSCFGSDVVLIAFLDTVHRLCERIATFPFTHEVLCVMRDVYLLPGLARSEPNVRAVAVKAFASWWRAESVVLASSSSGSSGGRSYATTFIADALQRVTHVAKHGGKDESPHVASSRGYALALTALPDALLRGRAVDVLQALSILFRDPTTRQPTMHGDVETRAHVCQAIAHVASVVCAGDDEDNVPAVAIKDVLGEALALLAIAMEDYATDHRGDIGSWTRQRAMEALTAITVALSAKIGDGDPGAWCMLCVPGSEAQSVYWHELMPLLVQQCVGKIDRVRGTAWASLKAILPLVPDDVVSCRQHLMDMVARLEYVHSIMENHRSSTLIHV